VVEEVVGNVHQLRLVPLVDLEVVVTVMVVVVLKQLVVEIHLPYLLLKEKMVELV
jgi:hypothetical protein